MHGHGLFKTVQDLIYRERLIIFSNNKYVLLAQMTFLTQLSD